MNILKAFLGVVLIIVIIAISAALFTQNFSVNKVYATAEPTNHNPVITTLTLEPGKKGENYSRKVKGFDVDKKDTLSMGIKNLPDGLSKSDCIQKVSHDTKEIVCKISGVPTQKGTFTVTVKLKDDKGGKDQEDIELKIK